MASDHGSVYFSWSVCSHMLGTFGIWTVVFPFTFAFFKRSVFVSRFQVLKILSHFLVFSFLL